MNAGSTILILLQILLELCTCILNHDQLQITTLRQHLPPGPCAGIMGFADLADFPFLGIAFCKQAVFVPPPPGSAVECKTMHGHTADYLRLISPTIHCPHSKAGRRMLVVRSVVCFLRSSFCPLACASVCKLVA